jgi:uncharacterized protein (TIGR03084 family)
VDEGRELDPPSMIELCEDAVTEHDEVVALLTDLNDTDWAVQTPSAGWTVRDQIAHLAWFDRAATSAVSDPQTFASVRNAAASDVDALVERVRLEQLGRSGPDTACWWTLERLHLAEVVRDLPRTVRVAWFGPDMSLATHMTARIMETWAHGQDVADALGRTRFATDRIRHVAHIGVRTRSYSYIVRGMEPPLTDVRVELVAPSGACWAWGSAEATDRICGSALDFCLVVTQRRHVTDTELQLTDGVASQWMDIAQAFAGPPGVGRRPGQFLNPDR